MKNTNTDHMNGYVDFISWQKALFILLALFLLMYLLPLNLRPIIIPDEVRYGEIAREMLASGNWIVPHFIGFRYFEKPPMGHWLNALSLFFFDTTPFGVRFASALSSGLTAISVFFLILKTTRRVYPALLASVIYLTFLQVFIIGILSTLDAMLTLWLTLAMIVFFLGEIQWLSKIKAYSLLGFFCGMAFLTKGFLALAVPVLVIVPYMFWQRRFLELLRHSWIPMLVAALIILPWGIVIHLQENDFWRYFFWEEHIKRFSADNAHHSEPFWFFIPVLLLLSLPWTTFAPIALGRFFVQQNQSDVEQSVSSVQSQAQTQAMQTRLRQYVLMWFIMPFIFFSISKGKLPTYILPCYVPLSIILALGFERTYGLKTMGLKTMLMTQTQKILEIFGATVNIIVAVSFVIAVVAIQWFDVSHPLYQSNTNESLFKTMILIAAIAAWGIASWWFISKRLKHSHWKPFAIALLPMSLMVFLPAALPDKVIQIRSPGNFMSQQQKYVQPDTVLIAEHVMMGAVSWFYHRDDIYLAGGKGELRYGLDYPDAAYRHLSYKELKTFIEQKRQVQTVMFFDKASSVEKLDYLPEADQIMTEGQFILRLYYPPLSVDQTKVQ